MPFFSSANPKISENLRAEVVNLTCFVILQINYDSLRPKGNLLWQMLTNLLILKSFIPEKYKDLAYIGTPHCRCADFPRTCNFYGWNFGSTDNVASNSFTLILMLRRKAEILALWNPHICRSSELCSVIDDGDRWYDFVSKGIFGFSQIMGALFKKNDKRIAFFYMLYGAGMYFVDASKKHERFTAFLRPCGGLFRHG